MKVFLTGATGFVGSHLLTRLISTGHTVRALVRNPSKASLPVSAQVEAVSGDVIEGTGLDEGMKGCEAVIHLVGIIAESRGATFEQVHHQGTRNVVEAAKRNHIGRFVQMSALGARADGVSEYQTSKWKAEEAVRQSGMPFCILRPSLIFGPGAGFVIQMLDIMRKAIFIRPVPGDGRPKFRPVAIDDVTTCFARALTTAGATGRSIDLGGAEELTLNEILREIAAVAGIRKPAFHVPLPIMFAMASLAQAVLPSPPVTVGQLKMLREGSTCDPQPMMQVFSVQPAGFREGIRAYLSV
ncbi:MAG TPA: complex I NDUFA9 subunit family protein [Candidatus Saccharimonadales bacterium]|jgi:uncharacterized protein YbjT (DUF2867 family)|nr:complex I NDUFA9 subunit family protein [Candidatus Saccharimonadales bacterium]